MNNKIAFFVKCITRSPPRNETQIVGLRRPMFFVQRNDDDDDNTNNKGSNNNINNNNNNTNKWPSQNPGKSCAVPSTTILIAAPANSAMRQSVGVVSGRQRRPLFCHLPQLPLLRLSLAHCRATPPFANNSSATLRLVACAAYCGRVG